MLPLILIGGLFWFAVVRRGDDGGSRTDSANVTSSIGGEFPTAGPAPTTSLAPLATATLPTATPLPTAAPAGPWPAGVDFPTHTIPALIRDEIATLGGAVGYGFTGQAGDQWRITAEARDGQFDPQVTVYAPSGAVAASNDDWLDGVSTADLLVRLGESGLYRVLITSSDTNPTTGTYLFALFPE